MSTLGHSTKDPQITSTNNEVIIKKDKEDLKKHFFVQIIVFFLPFISMLLPVFLGNLSKYTLARIFTAIGILTIYSGVVIWEFRRYKKDIDYIININEKGVSVNGISYPFTSKISLYRRYVYGKTKPRYKQVVLGINEDKYLITRQLSPKAEDKIFKELELLFNNNKNSIKAKIKNHAADEGIFT